MRMRPRYPFPRSYHPRASQPFTPPSQVKAQALIFHTLRAEMPKMTGKDRKQRELIAGLEDVFLKVAA